MGGEGVIGYGGGGIGDAGDKLRFAGIGQANYRHLGCPLPLNNH